jgi:ABC-2 type transport system ATP-binding protein
VLTEIERVASRVMILLDGRLLTTDAMRAAGHPAQVRLRIGGPRPAILAALRQLQGVVDATLERVDTAPGTVACAPAEIAETYLVETEPGRLAAADLARGIVGQGFDLAELVEVKPDLERVFLDLTRRASATETNAA